MTYKNLQTPVKDAIREALHLAQHGRCAYCESRIPLDSLLTKIEHFHPQSSGAEPESSCFLRTDLALATIARSDVTWKNLLLCCSGVQGAEKSKTCDTSKHNTDICGVFYNPRELTESHASLVSVSLTGELTAVYYPDEQGSAQTVIDKVLNINLQLLQDNRAAVFQAYLKRFQARKDANKGKLSMQDLRDQFAAKPREDIARGMPYPSLLLSIAAFVAR